MRKLQKSLVATTAAVLALAALQAPAQAQKAKLARKYHEDEQAGYRFKGLDDWNGIPLQPGQGEGGLVARMSGQVMTEVGKGHRQDWGTDIYVFRFEDQEREKEEGEEERSAATAQRANVADAIQRYSRLAGFKADKPELDEEVKIKKVVARHRIWYGDVGLNSGESLELMIATWTFRFPDADFALAYVLPREHEKKFLKVCEKSAKTFERIDEVAGTELAKGASYEDLIAYHEELASKVAGWHVVPTPSKKFIIKTSSDKKKFIDDVIKRLEASRELYEQDFPPSKDFDAVSVVRVCDTEEEFHKYGKTGGGVAGWFNPGTTELVLYNSKNIDPNMTFAVMSHEAFHQYCHFLFDQSEAHRWFDEGHGDYYGGVEFTGSRAKVTKRMPAGLNRLDIVKNLVREGSYAPIADHINFNHPEWQSRGLDSYSQSWSIIFFLRQGADGKVRGKIWKDEYAEIIPNYVTTLFEGYRKAYEGEDGPDIELGGEGGRRLVMPDEKKEIWKAAIEASWGKIDLDQFEEDWAEFVGDL